MAASWRWACGSFPPIVLKKSVFASEPEKSEPWRANGIEMRGTARLDGFAANVPASDTTPASHSESGPKGHFGLIFEKPDLGVFQHNPPISAVRNGRSPDGSLAAAARLKRLGFFADEDRT